MKEGWEVGVGGGVFVGDEERERGEYFLLVKHQEENTVFLAQCVSELHCLSH